MDEKKKTAGAILGAAGARAVNRTLIDASRRKTMAEQELRDCPNPECGGGELPPRPIQGSSWYVRCKYCGLRGPLSDTEGGAMRIWNLIALPRPTADAVEEAKEVAKLRTALKWYKEQVSFCNNFTERGDTARDALAKDNGSRAREALREGEVGPNPDTVREIRRAPV